MRLLTFLLVALLTAALGWAGSRSWGMLPPFGTLLSPFTGIWQQLQTPKAPSAHPEGLREQAEVVFDKHGVPHIYARNAYDMYFLQGYLTARDRLWQMEFQTHAAAGRLSEIIGGNEGLVNYDREMRRTGMVFAARNSLKAMNEDPQTREALEAYAQGVNAWISELTPTTLPLEYKLLDYKPENWTPLKSALLLKYMARDLAMGNRDLEYTNALRAFGDSIFQLLYPTRLVDEPVIENVAGWDFDPVILPDTLSRSFLEKSIKKPLIDSPPPEWGSNNWAVSASKTANGNPILCGDPHLGLSLPSLWYQIHLHAPDCDVGGVSLPGAPAVIIGFTDSIAWSPTNATRDVVDWYHITFEDSTRDRYWYDGEWRFTKTRIEEIRRRGEEPLYDTVSYTHFGPVVYDRSFASETGEAEGLAMRWIAHDSSNELRTFIKLNRAKNYTDYRNAIRTYRCPAQNFAFAAAQGDIAMSVQGKFPLRYPDQGKFILDGRYPQNEWPGYIPNEHNPHQKNPERGYVSSANQYPVDSTYPYYVFHYSYETYRNRVLNRTLDTLDSITVQDMMALQNNNFGYKAYESLPFLLRQLDQAALSAEQQEAAKLLQNWDFDYAPQAKAPPYFEAWWEQLENRAWDEFASDTFALYKPKDVVLYRLLRDTTRFSVFDRRETPETETGTDLIRESFRFAVDSVIGTWQQENDSLSWAAYKGTEIRHIARVSGLGTEHLPIGGYRSILNAASEHHGPSWRMVVELTPEGPNAWGIYPGGQSGNPGSPFYDNLVSDWARGGYHPVPFTKTPDVVPEPSARYKFSPQ